MTRDAARDRPENVWHLDLPDESATMSLAADIASLLQPGDLVTLSGELGCGKTTFARALIRSLTGDKDLEVPSPTFTLLQVYDSVIKDGAKFPIVHADLFRIKDPSELAELGWDEAADGALVIVEWPERAGGGLSGDRLDITFHTDTGKPPGYRLGAVIGVRHEVGHPLARDLQVVDLAVIADQAARRLQHRRRHHVDQRRLQRIGGGVGLFHAAYDAFARST